jgi:hypothetical protein
LGKSWEIIMYKLCKKDYIFLDTCICPVLNK